MRFKDYYQTLGIERSASAEDIKRAYRKLAHQYHPDVSKDPKSEEKFKEIAEAYATLKDPDKRKEYDSLGSRPAGASFTPPPDWQQHFGAGVSYFDDVDLADILSAFTSSRQGDGRGRRQGAIAGQDYGVTAPVTLEQVFHGGEIDIHANLPEQDQYGVTHHVPRTFRVTIPKGAAHGQRLRLPGKGGQGVNGGKSAICILSSRSNRIRCTASVAAICISIFRWRRGKRYLGVQSRFLPWPGRSNSTSGRELPPVSGCAYLGAACRRRMEGQGICMQSCK